MNELVTKVEEDEKVEDIEKKICELKNILEKKEIEVRNVDKIKKLIRKMIII